MKDNIAKYARLTTAIFNSIGHETRQKYCDFCSSSVSVGLDQIFCKEFGYSKDSKEAKARHYIGRDWFPLAGSVGSDVQGLPTASRSLNACAKCLFAVQYLPRGSILTNAMLTLFQSTSVEFWYEFVKNVVEEVKARLKAATAARVETLGKAEGNGEVVNRLLEVMRVSRTYDSKASMIMYQYNNGGQGPRLLKQFIPNSTLTFLHEAAISGLREEIRVLTIIEQKRKTSYRYSLFNRIAQREDYNLLYPKPSEKYAGASPALFALYQNYIRGYPIALLQIAYKIAEYLKTKTETEKLVVNLLSDGKKQTCVMKWLVSMVDGGLLPFDEYFELFVESNRNPWALLRYYLLNDREVGEFKATIPSGTSNINDYKAVIVKVGTMIYERHDSLRLKKLLAKLAAGTIHRGWLVRQFEHLADENADFDYVDNWNSLRVEENLYEVLYLFRLLFTSLRCTIVG